MPRTRRNPSEEDKARTIQPRFRRIASIDTATAILGKTTPSFRQTVESVMRRVLNQFGKNELDRLDGFFMDYIVMGEGDPDVVKKGKYPPPLLPGIVKSYGINWRDFAAEYKKPKGGGEDRRNLTRKRVANACRWMAAAYWLAPDWLYDSNYIELVNYRRWVNPMFLKAEDWGRPMRANPCIMEEGIRKGMTPWVNKVLGPWFRDRIHETMKDVAGKGRISLANEDVTHALFYKTIYDKTLKSWYEQQVGALKNNKPQSVPFVKEIPPRHANRRASEQFGDERQYSDEPAPSQTRSDRVRHMSKSEKQLRREEKERKRMTVVKREHDIDKALGPPPGSASRPTHWKQLDAQRYGEAFANYITDAMKAGLADDIDATMSDDEIVALLFRAWRGKGGALLAHGNDLSKQSTRRAMHQFVPRIRAEVDKYRPEGPGREAAAAQESELEAQLAAAERWRAEEDARERARERRAYEERMREPEPEPDAAPLGMEKPYAPPPAGGAKFRQAQGA